LNPDRNSQNKEAKPSKPLLRLEHFKIRRRPPKAQQISVQTNLCHAHMIAAACYDEVLATAILDRLLHHRDMMNRPATDSKTASPSSPDEVNPCRDHRAETDT
jgi:hypothetical protein